MVAPTLTEVVALVGLFAIIFGLAAALHAVRQAASPSTDVPELDTEYVQRETPAMRARRRRGGLARMRRAVENNEDTSSGLSPPTETTVRRSKKKEANREAKREAREAHFARLEAIREQQAQRDEQLAEEEAREEEEARRAEEAQRVIAEEKEKKETKEYESWKDLISVEDSGEGAELENESPDMLHQFCEYVKSHKIVVLEELAGEFDMRTEDVVDRLTRLEQSGEVTGFFDDRGKFIYVSMAEMENVAKFIKKKGRVSIQELSAESTSLLHLDAEVSS